MNQKYLKLLLLSAFSCIFIEQLYAAPRELVDIITVVSPKDNNIRFDDVIGRDEIKQLAQSIVPAFKDPGLYIRQSKHIPKDVFLTGYTGNGKKMFARAFAGETNASVIQLSGASLAELTPIQIHELFAQAKKMAPCVIIIDQMYEFLVKMSDQEILSSEAQAYLDEMDSLDASAARVIIFGTSTYVSGMKYNFDRFFDANFVFARPSFAEKVDFLISSFKDIKKSEDFNISIIARLMIGRSYSELIKVVEVMKELSQHNNSSDVTMDFFDKAFRSVDVDAEEGFDAQSSDDRKKSAIHESGHALAVIFHPSQCALYNISLRQDSRSYGRIQDVVLSEPYYSTEDELLHDIVVGLGGGTAEQVCDLPEPCNINNCNGLKDFISRPGVGSDWEPVCKKAHEVVKIRCKAAGRSDEECNVCNGDEMVKVIQACYEVTREILILHKDDLEKLAECALEKEVVYADEAYAICGKVRPKCDFEK